LEILSPGNDVTGKELWLTDEYGSAKVQLPEGAQLCPKCEKNAAACKDFAVVCKKHFAVKLTDEQGPSGHPAHISICWDGVEVRKILAATRRKQGADGGFYDVVTLTEEATIADGADYKILSITDDSGIWPNNFGATSEIPR
jgi:hypothetical protein